MRASSSRSTADVEDVPDRPAEPERRAEVDGEVAAADVHDRPGRRPGRGGARPPPTRTRRCRTTASRRRRAPRPASSSASASPGVSAMNSTFVRFGNRSSCSRRGPCWVTRAVAGSSTNRTRCGLPTPGRVTAVGRAVERGFEVERARRVERDLERVEGDRAHVDGRVHHRVRGRVEREVDLAAAAVGVDDESLAVADARSVRDPGQGSGRRCRSSRPGRRRR